MTRVDSGQQSVCPLGIQYQRYWDKLSLPERQMRIDVEGLYSMDTQEVAMDLAGRIRSARVIDAFCGIGGAAIAFARAGKAVEAIELDPSRLEMARCNATHFGVAESIVFRQGDALELLAGASDAAVYLDPPWGGPSYGKLEKFSLNHFSPDGRALLQKALECFGEVLFKLPKNFDFAEFNSIREPSEIVRNELHGALEYYTAIFRSTSDV